MPVVSIVICSIDAAKFARVCANYRALFAGRETEIVGIHDARSLAEGYHRGIAAARGETLILSHDDIEILNADFAPRLANALATFDLIGIAGTTRVVEGKWASAGDPHVFALVSSPDPERGGYGTMLLGGGPVAVPGIQALDGVFLALRREVAAATPFDAEAFDGFHLYDLDFSFRAHQAGFRLAVCRDIVLVHESTGGYDEAWARYKRRFEDKHRAHLPDAWTSKVGARAAFASASRADILRLCTPERIGEIAQRIERSNASL
jgi:GT2 family glycosyltransferase